MTAPDEDDLPDVGTLEDTEPVVLEEAPMPATYLRRAARHLGGRLRLRPDPARGVGPEA